MPKQETPTVDLTGYIVDVPSSTTDGEIVRKNTLRMDFSGTPFADLIAHATKSVKIDKQRELRKVLATVEDGAIIDVPVKAYTPGRRVRDPMAKADRAMAGLTDAQRAELLQKYTQ